VYRAKEVKAKENQPFLQFDGEWRFQVDGTAVKML